MREQVMDALGTALMNNIGNRLTPELANGIATAVNQVLLTLSAPLPAASPIPPGEAVGGG